MDTKQHRHSSLTVPSSYPAPSRHSPPYPRYRSTSLKNPINYTSEPPRPASLVRVKGQMALNTPPPKSSDMTWASDQSPRRGTPGRPGTPRTPGTPRRAGTPDAGASSLVNPSSALLQDLLKEQRASRGTRGPASEDMEGQVPRTPDRPQSQAQSQSQSQSQSQDDGASERKRKVNSALSAGLRQPREMGVREMDQYVSKMNKQNFDLKLEIFHRAQQATALEKRLERMEELEEEVKRMRGLEDELQELRNAEEDNQRLRGSNEQLRQELDKRDQAVTEAVELICELEARTDELEGGSRPSTSNGPDDATPKQRTTIDIPERTSSRRGVLLGQYRPLSPESRHLQSAPSFLRDENKNTAVLRGLYIPSGDQSQSAMSVVTKSESLNSINEPTEPASPRLSALSECSDLLPEDVPVIQGGLDKPENATETATASSDTLGLRHVEHESKRGDIDINQWIQPLPDMPTNIVSPAARTNRASMFEFKSPTNEGDMNMNDARQRVRLDGFFGASRLPPTPDTMSTAYAARTNPSNGSIQADKGQLEFMKQRLGRPRSFDDLASRRSSGNSGNTDSVDTNISDISRPGLGTNERDEAPANVPLNAVSYKHRRRATCQEPPPSWPGLDYCEGDNDKGMERVLSKMDNNHYSPDSTEPPSKRHTVNFTSSSPPLTPQDWVEAANSNPRSRKEIPHTPHSYDTYSGPASIDSGFLGARRPGQSAFHGRRHSMGSPFQELKPAPEPTLDLRSLEHAPRPVLRPAPAPPSESTSRRRISFRPPFLSRLANPRRPQPPPGGDTGHSGGGAPSPVVPKTRSMASKSPQVNENVERPGPSRAVPNTPIPTYADPRKQDNVHRTLPHSFTESNLWSSGTAPRPMTSTSKENKRRSSLGLFGWVKEASGIGHSKKPEPTSPSGMRRRTSPRVAPDAPAIPETTPTGANPDVDEDELGRRPRYVERRARRV